jgi:hypothetical protein
MKRISKHIVPVIGLLALCASAALPPTAVAEDDHIWDAVATGDLDAIKQRLADGQDINAKAPSVGLTPLMAAAITGQTDAAKLLLDEGANPNLKSSKDGATALHMAAFFGHIEIVKALLGRGADTKILNDRSETPLDTVRGDWSDELEGFYKLLGGMLKLELNLAKIKAARPQIAAMLAESGGKSGPRENKGTAIEARTSRTARFTSTSTARPRASR